MSCVYEKVNVTSNFAQITGLFRVLLFTTRDLPVSVFTICMTTLLLQIAYHSYHNYGQCSKTKVNVWLYGLTSIAIFGFICSKTMANLLLFVCVWCSYSKPLLIISVFKMTELICGNLCV